MKIFERITLSVPAGSVKKLGDKEIFRVINRPAVIHTRKTSSHATQSAARKTATAEVTRR
jgi:hypothetical protein